MDLSVIIVHYKTPELLKKCIASLYNGNEGIRFEIIVVDNDSQDQSEELIRTTFPQVKWINSGYNAGFARANNIGIRNSTGDYVLLLNPDSYAAENFLEKLYQAYIIHDKNGSLGLLSCRIISSVDGSLLVGSGVGFPGFKRYIQANPIYIFLTRRFIKQKKYNPHTAHYTSHEIDFVSGACVMLKRSKIEKHMLYLDEDFFLYFEDVEWSHRVQRKGYKNYFDSSLEVYHENSASTSKSAHKEAQINASELLYYRKVYNAILYKLLALLIKINIRIDRHFAKKAGNKVLFVELQEKEMRLSKYIPLVEKNYARGKKAEQYLKYSL